VVLRVFESGLLPESDAIGIDETKQGQFADPLMNFGLQFEQMVQIRQGGFLSGAIWDAEVRLKAKTLRHCGQPLMSWAVSNGKIERTGNYVKMVKETAGAAKIDPLIAMFNALILLRRNPVASTPEVIKIPENYEVF
jgi:phage terminase large subunit-like protein